MALRRCSVSEARQNLARLIRDAEHGRAVEITRRGEPAVVLLSASLYQALTSERSSFIAAVGAIRERLAVAQLDIGETEFDGIRDKAPSREVPL